MRNSAFYCLSSLIIFGLTQSASKTIYPKSLDNYQEECVVEGCSLEEVVELDDKYNEECLAGVCSGEELIELAGIQTAIDPMLEAFLSNGWVVNSDSFQSQTFPPANQVWWYTGCNLTGLVTAAPNATNTSTQVSPMPNNFNNRILGVQIGANMANVVVFTNPGFTGSSQILPTSVPCLATSFPQFANTIQSAQAGVN